MLTCDTLKKKQYNNRLGWIAFPCKWSVGHDLKSA